MAGVLGEGKEMSSLVKHINRDVLRECREQLKLELGSDELKKLKWLEKAERGEKYPTLKQLESLATFYGVPSWVFVAKSLPEEYKLTKEPAFRQFAEAGSEAFSNYKIRIISARVVRLRDLIMKLRQEMGEEIAPFEPPIIEKHATPEQAAEKVRKWLDIKINEQPKVLKQKVEDKNIFIFMTGKYAGWSHKGKSIFRGLSIYYSTLPIIIINNSDAKKAQHFTLFHELGHLLRREHAIDDYSESGGFEEKWCDKFAGSLLMPDTTMREITGTMNNLNDIEDIAKKLAVSSYACLVRLHQLSIISAKQCDDFKNELYDKYDKEKQKSKEGTGRLSRDRPKEVIEQYGSIYSATILQAYRNDEIGLSKLCKLFDLKQVSHANDLDGHL